MIAVDAPGISQIETHAMLDGSILPQDHTEHFERTSALDPIVLINNFGSIDRRLF